jgi:hypothetical protein
MAYVMRRMGVVQLPCDKFFQRIVKIFAGSQCLTNNTVGIVELEFVREKNDGQRKLCSCIPKPHRKDHIYMYIYYTHIYRLNLLKH